MTEHKTMNTIIHAAFRRDLRRFDDALAAFPARSAARAGELGTAWANFAHQLRHHHEDEETIFWPALRSLGADEALVGDLDGEHKQMLNALDAADEAMQALGANPTSEAATAARTALTGLSTVIEDHLTHEERDLEQFAADHLKSPPMKAARRLVTKAHKGEAGTFFAWLQDGADPAARAALRREVPAPVLFVISRIGGRDYNRRVAPVWA